MLQNFKERFKLIREGEEGVTMADILVGMVLTSIITIFMTQTSFSGLGFLNDSVEKDNTVSGSTVATDLRNIQQEALTCVANYEAPKTAYGTATSGSYQPDIDRSDIEGCLAPIQVPATLHYEIIKTGNKPLCIAGYDTVTDTDKYNAQTPYIHYLAYGVIYEGADTPCGDPKEIPFDWSGMKK